MIDGFLRKANRPMTMNDPKKAFFQKRLPPSGGEKRSDNLDDPKPVSESRSASDADGERKGLP
jgi:hypothetical protein